MQSIHLIALCKAIEEAEASLSRQGEGGVHPVQATSLWANLTCRELRVANMASSVTQARNISL